MLEIEIQEHIYIFFFFNLKVYELCKNVQWKTVFKSFMCHGNVSSRNDSSGVISYQNKS